MGQQYMGQPHMGQQNMGQQNMGQQHMGQQYMGQQHMGQQWGSQQRGHGAMPGGGMQGGGMHMQAGMRGGQYNPQYNSQYNPQYNTPYTPDTRGHGANCQCGKSRSVETKQYAPDVPRGFPSYGAPGMYGAGCQCPDCYVQVVNVPVPPCTATCQGDPMVKFTDFCGNVNYASGDFVGISPYDDAPVASFYEVDADDDAMRKIVAKPATLKKKIKYFVQ